MLHPSSTALYDAAGNQIDMALTPSQEEALQQLLAVTASSTPSARERDERILREVGWNVQNAVEAIFAGDMEPSTTSAGPSRQSSLNAPGSGTGLYDRFEVDDSYQSRSTGSSSRRHSDSYGGRRPNGAGTTGVGLGSIIAFPLKLVFGILTGTWYFIIRNFIPLSLYPRLPRFLLPPSGPTSTYRSARTHNATDSSLAFLQDLESFTGHSASSGSLPELWIGSYRDFMLDVRKQGKVGVVILVSGEHEDDEEFKKEVLGDHELIRLLKEKDVLVWAQDVRSRDGYQAAQTLLVTTYPSLSFCSLLPTNPNSNSTTSPKLSILTSIAGPPSTSTSASSIIQTLTTSVLPRATPFLNRLKRERLSLEEARHLREEQDRAFREAERKDREKLLAQRQTAELERTKVERAESEKSDKEKRQRDRKHWRRYARKHLLTPSAQVTSTTPGAIRVSIRTPLSPERNVRYFVPNPSTEQLFIYAETLLIPKTDAEAQDPDSPPEGYEPEWDFRIVTTFPRKEIDKKESGGEDAWKTVKDAGGALFAEKVEGGTWADEELKELNGDDSDEEVEEE